MDDVRDNPPRLKRAPSREARVALTARARAWWLPAAISIGGLAATLLLWSALRSFERSNLAFIADAEAERAADDLRNGMQSLTATFTRIAQRYAGKLRAKEQWEVSLTGLTASLWVEPGGKVAAVAPLVGHEDLAGADLAASEVDRDAMLRARRSGQTALTPSILRTVADSTFHVVVPVSEGGELQGFVVGVFSGRPIYAAALHSTAPGWSLAVFEGRRQVYLRGAPLDGGSLGEARATVEGAERRVLASPSPEVVARMHSPLPGVVLASGSAISLLLAAAARLSQSSRRRARDAEAAQAALKDSQASLQAAQQRLAHVVASSPAVLYSLRIEGMSLVPLWVSENLQRLTGYVPGEITHQEWWVQRIHPDDRERVMAQVPTLLADGHVSRVYRFRAKDGFYRWIRDEQVVIRDAAGNPAEVVGSWSDVTAQKEAELKVEESEEQYRLLFDSNPHPMWVYDEDTRAFLAVNDAAVRHYGYSREEFLAMTLRDIRPPEEIPAVEAFAAARRQESGMTAFRSARVWKHRKKDGTLLDVKIAGSPLAFQGRPAWLVLASDVTEETRLQAQLLQSQKMESVGRLAGGVAHDFNNLLGVITGYGELLQRDIGPGHPSYARVAEIQKAADRAAALTRQLLAFSRKQLLEPRVLDLNAVVSDTERMLHRLIGEDVQLVTVFAPGLGAVKADPGQMEQVIVNLAVNARDAMPQGGKLILETANVELDEGYARTRPDARAGPHVMLAISDTGHGINAETMSHLFEPFFTTKEQGKGTGLGLATVHGIVRQSGGHVTVYSEPGRGTTFKVYLPRFDARREVVPPSASTAAAPSGTETILLVEDETALRVLIGEILESAGYRVLEGPTPEEALAAAGSHRGPIALVLTDVILPRMSGRQVAEVLRSSRPEARVLFMSGYTDDAIGHHGILDEGVHFLQKPFTSDSLLGKVREVLDAPAEMRRVSS